MLEGLHPNNPTHVARIVTDEMRARRIADLLGESFDPTETAIAAFEKEDGTAKPPWLVEVYEREVIGGFAAFVIPAQTRADFARALRQKLIQEIASR